VRERDTSVPPEDIIMEPDEQSNTVDVLRYGKEGKESSKYVTVPSEMGMRVIALHREEMSKRRLRRTALAGFGAFLGAGVASIYNGIAVGILVAIIVVVFAGTQEYLRGYGIPELVDTAVHRGTAEEDYDIHIHVEEPFEGGEKELQT